MDMIRKTVKDALGALVCSGTEVAVYTTSNWRSKIRRGTFIGVTSTGRFVVDIEGKHINLRKNCIVKIGK